MASQATEAPSEREAPAVFGGFSQTAARDVVAARKAEQRVLDAIDRLGLRGHAWELDTRGYTVLPPGKAAPSAVTQELLARVLAAGERIHGIALDVERGLSEPGRQMQFGAGVSMPGLLFEDPLFEQALMNEPVLALISYLLGESCQLSSMGGIVKAQGDAHLELHADLVGNPSPYPPYAQVANATWVLTDYDRDNGSTCFVDGSHLLCRPPSPAEAVDLSLFTPIEAPAGSVIIWGSNVWHGAVPRLAAGLRVSLLVFFARWYLYKSETDIAARVTPDMLARNPARFRRLTGIDPVALIAEEEDAPTMGRAALSRFA